MILERILRDKKIEVSRAKKRIPLEKLKQQIAQLPKRKSRFLSALKKGKGVHVIAEIKRRSPSNGLLCRDFDPVKIARQYERAGASALSVLTDKKYFGGSSAILEKVRKATPLPILRKDFTIDAYQIYEAQAMGADAILLIVRTLSKGSLKKFYAVAEKLGLETLFEIHDEADWKKIASLKTRVVGINNRDLSNFHVDLGVTKRLAPKIGKGPLVVSESGISSAEDLTALKECGVRAVLVGEKLMRESDPGKALRRLLQTAHAR